MKKLITYIVTAIFSLTLTACQENSLSPDNQPAAVRTQPVKAVLLTAGHDFDSDTFLAMFTDMDNVEVVHAPQKDHSEIFENIDNWPYDVIILYNMTQQISEKRQANFIKLLNDGVGIVMMHHAVAAYQSWDEYPNIVGAKYYLNEDKQKNIPASIFKHGTDMHLYTADKNHPVMRGIAGFIVHDETYKNVIFEQGNTPLMTTDNPISDEMIVWARTYSNAKVCGIQPGHGTSIFADENYRNLIKQAIKWTAKKSK